MKRNMIENYLRMIGNEMDSVKHQVRGIKRGLDALLVHLKIGLQPDSLEEYLNPSSAAIDEIVAGARFAHTQANKPEPTKRRKRRSKK